MTDFILKNSDDYTQVVMDMFSKNPPQYGVQDVYALGPKVAKEVLSTVITILMLMIKEENEKPIFCGVHVISPIGSTNDEKSVDAITKLINRYLQNTKEEEIKKILKYRYHVHNLDSNSIPSLLAILSKIPEKSAVIIADAQNIYPELTDTIDEVSSSTTLTPVDETLYTWFSEDRWVPQIVSLSDHIKPVVKNTNLYLIYLIGYYRPQKQINLERLQNIEGGVFCCEMDNDLETMVIKNYERWISKINAGEMEDVKREIIERFPQSDHNLELVLAQLLMIAGKYTAAYLVIAPLLEYFVANVEADILIILSRIALYSGHIDESRSILSKAVTKGLNEEIHLRAMHQLAQILNAKDLKQRLLKELEQKFPSSDYLCDLKMRELLAQRAYKEVVNLLDPLTRATRLSSLQTFFYHFAEYFAKSYSRDIGKEFIEFINQNMPEYINYAVAISIQELWERDEGIPSIDLIKYTDVTKEYANMVAERIINLFNEVLLMLQVSIKQKGIDRKVCLVEMLQFLIRFLAMHPSNGNMRNMIIEAVSKASSGMLGHTLMIQLMFQSVELKVDQKEDELQKGDDRSYDFITYFKHYWEYKEKQRQQVIPLVPEKLDDTVKEIASEKLLHTAYFLLHDITGQIGSSDEDRKVRLKILKASIDLAYTFGSLVEVMRMVGAAAQNAAQMRDYQGARDLVENVLILAQSNKLTQSKESDLALRLAWHILADVYMRCNNISEALLGILCADQFNGSVFPFWLIYEEAILRVRILRDLGFYKEAYQECYKLKCIAERYDTSSVAQRRIAQLVSTIEFSELLSEHIVDAKIKTEKLRFIERTLTDVIIDAVKNVDDIIPPASLLLQVCLQLYVIGEVPERNSLEQLDKVKSKLGKAAQRLLHIFGSPSLNGHDLIRELEVARSARYFQDLGMDSTLLRILSKRILEHLEQLTDEELLVALSCLTDQSILFPSKIKNDIQFSPLDQKIYSKMQQQAFSVDSVSERSSDIESLKSYRDHIENHRDGAQILSGNEIEKIAKDLSQKNINLLMIATNSLALLQSEWVKKTSYIEATTCN